MAAVVIGAQRREDKMSFVKTLACDAAAFIILTTFLAPAASAATVTNVYSSTGIKAGYLPLGSVLKIGSTLYVAMNRGGSIGGLYGGTVDKVLIGSGHETTLHSFGALNDGANPQGNLVEIGGVLYGTTFEGGVNGGDPGRDRAAQFWGGNRRTFSDGGADQRWRGSLRHDLLRRQRYRL
jgi:hypothetical protein